MSKGIVLPGMELNIRNAMSTAAGTDTQLNLYAGDVVYGTILGSWIAFNGVYRVGNPSVKETFNGTRYAAIQNPSNPAQKYMTISNEAEPQPGPTPTPTPTPTNPIDPFTITISCTGNNEVKIVAQTTQSVTLEIGPT